MLKAQDLDNRRQEQIQNQIAAINRMAACLNDVHGGGAWTYTDEMQVLHEQLATTQAALRELIRVVIAHSASHDQFQELHAAADKALAVLEAAPEAPGKEGE